MRPLQTRAARHRRAHKTRRRRHRGPVALDRLRSRVRPARRHAVTRQVMRAHLVALADAHRRQVHPDAVRQHRRRIQPVPARVRRQPAPLQLHRLVRMHSPRRPQTQLERPVAVRRQQLQQLQIVRLLHPRQGPGHRPLSPHRQRHRVPERPRGLLHQVQFHRRRVTHKRRTRHQHARVGETLRGVRHRHLPARTQRQPGAGIAGIDPVPVDPRGLRRPQRRREQAPRRRRRTQKRRLAQVAARAAAVGGQRDRVLDRRQAVAPTAVDPRARKRQARRVDPLLERRRRLNRHRRLAREARVDRGRGHAVRARTEAQHPALLDHRTRPREVQLLLDAVHIVRGADHARDAEAARCRVRLESQTHGVLPIPRIDPRRQTLRVAIELHHVGRTVRRRSRHDGRRLARRTHVPVRLVARHLVKDHAVPGRPRIAGVQHRLRAPHQGRLVRRRRRRLRPPRRVLSKPRRTLGQKLVARWRLRRRFRPGNLHAVLRRRRRQPRVAHRLVHAHLDPLTCPDVGITHRVHVDPIRRRRATLPKPPVTDRGRRVRVRRLRQRRRIATRRLQVHSLHQETELRHPVPHQAVLAHRLLELHVAPRDARALVLGAPRERLRAHPRRSVAKRLAPSDVTGLSLRIRIERIQVRRHLQRTAAGRRRRVGRAAAVAGRNVRLPDERIARQHLAVDHDPLKRLALALRQGISQVETTPHTRSGCGVRRTRLLHRLRRAVDLKTLHQSLADRELRRVRRAALDLRLLEAGARLRPQRTLTTTLPQTQKVQTAAQTRRCATSHQAGLPAARPTTLRRGVEYSPPEAAVRHRTGVTGTGTRARLRRPERRQRECKFAMAAILLAPAGHPAARGCHFLPAGLKPDAPTPAASAAGALSQGRRSTSPRYRSDCTAPGLPPPPLRGVKSPPGRRADPEGPPSSSPSLTAASTAARCFVPLPPLRY